MPGVEQAVYPFVIMYILYQIPPTLMEIFSYYTRGGCVKYEGPCDDSFNRTWFAQSDMNIYWKRFLDRPTSEAARAYYGWLDWQAAVMDCNILHFRRNVAKHDSEVSMLRPYLFGPFLFNWPRKQWLRGDDAASFDTLRHGGAGPVWGAASGEAQARSEFEAAEAKGYRKHYHYQIMRRLKREQEAKQLAAKQLAAKPSAQ